MARIHANELGQTIEAMIKGSDDKERWKTIDLSFKLRGHKIRTLRNGTMAFFFVSLAFVLFGAPERWTFGATSEYIVVSVFGFFISWVSWRITLRFARELARDINDSIEENPIEDTQHPRVIFGPWIPSAMRSPYHKTKNFMMKWKKS